MHTLSSPIITSSINLHLPNLTFSGLPNVDTISPPVTTKCIAIFNAVRTANTRTLCAQFT